MAIIRRRAGGGLLRRAAVALACAVVTGALWAPSASAAPSGGVDIVDPATHVTLYETLSAQWWQWAFSTPNTAGGPFDNVDGSTAVVSCTENQPRSDVLFLAAPFTVSGSADRRCAGTIAENTRILVPIINTECSDVELDPFLGLTPEQRRSCVEKPLFDPSRLKLKVDKTNVVVKESRYGVISDDFAFTAVSGSPTGVPVGPGLSTSRGVWVLLEPLCAGTHTIASGGSYRNADFHESAEYTITVG
jgi:hypothetical protein